jgi:hypothetical protein
MREKPIHSQKGIAAARLLLGTMAKAPIVAGMGMHSNFQDEAHRALLQTGQISA